MALINILVVMATVMFAAVSADEACKGKDWKSKTLEQRAMEPKWVAYVQVVSKEMAVMGVNRSATDFEVVVNVTCWLKKGSGSDDDADGAPKTGDAPAAGDGDDDDDDSDETGMGGNMTIPDAGQNITILIEKVQCKTQTLEQGKKYVLFMEKHMDVFKIVNVNSESGSLAAPRDEDFQALHRGIASEMKAKPDWECVDGVEIACFEGKYDKAVCDGAASLVATMATIVAAILAVAIF